MSFLQMLPSPGHRLVRHAGDLITFELQGVPRGWTARIRTNLGRGERRREEVLDAGFTRRPLANASWRDIPLVPNGESNWSVTLPVAEVGFYQAKAYALDSRGYQHWPEGPDIRISVHPSWTRTSHPIYCAFPRMFGPNKTRRTTRDTILETQLAEWDAKGYAIIPPSGTLRGLQRELPHIIHRLGCRLLHLLPVSPTPTTFARFGRYGSPYALQHLTAIDPALVEFDRRTTGIQQFCELAHAVHANEARLMLDLVINHTGWGSQLWEEHPEWFVRTATGEFKSPGAWDVVWEDLVELDQRHAPLWEHLAEAFVTWCRRGVDAFRCDAGYKVPIHVWAHITARVQQEFPETLFLLEGLGGPWETTEALLGEGGMQWAYSELFQNFSPEAVTGYLDHSIRFGETVGLLAHYSETHDNSRLAAQASDQPPSDPGYSTQPTPPAIAGPAPNLEWSRYRNRLCALTSIQGAFGFTNGVEWGATEQINVHNSRGLAWGAVPNLVEELARLNELLRNHPCFFDGAQLTRLTPPHSLVYALERVSRDRADALVIAINLDTKQPHSLDLDLSHHSAWGLPRYDLLKPGEMPLTASPTSHLDLMLAPGAILCLSATDQPRGLAGDAYRRARARADWALGCWWAVRLERPAESTFSVPNEDWRALSEEVDRNPEAYLNRTLVPNGSYLRVVTWTPADANRVLLVPPHHWLLIRNTARFRATVESSDLRNAVHLESIATSGGSIASISPDQIVGAGRLTLVLEPFEDGQGTLTGSIFSLAADPNSDILPPSSFQEGLVLLTNGRGAMSRLQVNLGAIRSKYDCLLGANLHPSVPVDRHIFAKRVRAWVDADGFISQLDSTHLVQFEAGPPAQWRFVAPSGDGRYVAVRLIVDLLQESNTVVMAFSRDTASDVECHGTRPLPSGCRVSLTVRIDIEDRSFHSETKRHEGAEVHFATHCRPITHPQSIGKNQSRGFEFAPTIHRRFTALASLGEFHPEPEWSVNLPHDWEANRGQDGSGDAYSPGWFEIPLPDAGTVTVVATADGDFPSAERIDGFCAERAALTTAAILRADLPESDGFGKSLVRATQAYVVRRDATRSVIAGYPWFLDWGRDSLIAARGLLSAGLEPEVRELLLTFARFEQGGTLPNSIHGTDASNRDTSDAPLWLGIVCEDLAKRLTLSGQEQFYGTIADKDGRALLDILRSIACGYLAGTSNGIQADAQSGLVWSPSHFTWMDTNHPAGTPREGYPVEIQALWIRLLRQLDARKALPWEGRGEAWGDLARRAEKSLHQYFWLDEMGWYADVLMAARGVGARMSAPCDALRSNCLFLISLGIDRHPDFGRRAREMVAAAARHLLIPGALRSLAPLPVNPPLPIHRPGGGLLNDPSHPYWPRYEGDEDTRRKPAYHNGTGWLWTFPTFIEALVKAHPGDAAARAAARAYLCTTHHQLYRECLGQLPEICDGHATHPSRGCDAQAWSVTEALRVWRWLESGPA